MEPHKTIIIANRLPLRVKIKKEEWKLQPSEGGLATGLGSIFPHKNNLWIGWPGAVTRQPDLRQAVAADLQTHGLVPVWLTEQELHHYYEGFSNEVIWPLFHYFPTYADYKPAYWEAYQSVNQKFADVVIPYINPGDTIWVHDYQLMLLPGILRRKIPDLSIGYFQHIPFPSYELFRHIPWRQELLTGLLGADLIGFHIYDDVRHFLSATARILHIENQANVIFQEGRRIMADSFPMGIDFEKYRTLVFDEKTKRNERKLAQMIGDRKLIISIDRLDYSKGILQRLTAFELFLEQHPEFVEKVVFLQLIVPSRDTVAEYASLKEEVNRKVSDINGRYGSLSWQPILYFYRSMPIEMISAIYSMADVALVTPLRDGMNLVSKEYVASKVDLHGVLILSEMTGASKELFDALIINPNNIHEIAETLYQGLTMPAAEQRSRMETMQQTIQKFDVHNWVSNFMNRLTMVKNKQSDLKTRFLSSAHEQDVVDKFRRCKKRLLLLDYDGTLRHYENEPLKAAPDPELIKLLHQLSQNPQNKVVVISGRKMDTLEKWFGHLPMDMIAEHGVWHKSEKTGWTCSRPVKNDWKNEVWPLLRQYEVLTPGSFVEEKSYSLAWHYRKSDSGLGSLRAQEIRCSLKNAIQGLGLQLLEGNKVIEIKSLAINKGMAALKIYNQYKPDFALAIGDDHTDEDIFKVLPKDSVTIKVGNGASAARYYLRDVAEVRRFLKFCAGILKNDSRSSQSAEVPNQ